MSCSPKTGLFDLLQGENNFQDGLKYENCSASLNRGRVQCKYCEKLVCSDNIHSRSLYRKLEADCSNKVSEDESSPSPATNLTLTLLRCPLCQKDCSLWAVKTWWEILAILSSEASSKNGLFKIETGAEQLVLFILSQVCHNQLDYDATEKNSSPFLPPTVDEFGKILWLDGEAIGFYTVILPGSIDGCFNPDSYALPVVDTVYIRQPYRGQGRCTAIIDDVLNDFPDQDIAFSDPVSTSLMRALEKYLQRHPEHRDNIWEASYTGSEGYRRNIWLHIKRLNSKKMK